MKLLFQAEAKWKSTLITQLLTTSVAVNFEKYVTLHELSLLLPTWYAFSTARISFIYYAKPRQSKQGRWKQQYHVDGGLFFDKTIRMVCFDSKKTSPTKNFCQQVILLDNKFPYYLFLSNSKNISKCLAEKLTNQATFVRYLSSTAPFMISINLILKTTSY